MDAPHVDWDHTALEATVPYGHDGGHDAVDMVWLVSTWRILEAKVTFSSLAMLRLKARI